MLVLDDGELIKAPVEVEAGTPLYYDAREMIHSGFICPMELVAAINEAFGAPHLPEGFVRARQSLDGGVTITIAHRDLAFGPDGHLEGSGSDVVKMAAVEQGLTELWDKVKGVGSRA